MTLRTWTKDNKADEFFHIAHSFSSKEQEDAFKTEHGDKIVFPLTYVPMTEMIDGKEVVYLHTYTKDEIIEVINKNGGILFEYNPESDSGGNPEFEIMIPKDQSLLEKITMDVYQVEEREEYVRDCDFCSVEESPLVKDILP